MKISVVLLALIVVLFGIGCGSRGGTLTLTLESQTPSPNNNDNNNNNDNGSGDTGKSIFGLWTDADSGLYQVDLRSAAFDTASSMGIKFLTGENCSCSVLLHGTQSSGDINVSACTGNSLYCSGFNISSGTYTKSADNRLQVCKSGGSMCLNLQ